MKLVQDERSPLWYGRNSWTYAEPSIYSLIYGPCSRLCLPFQTKAVVEILQEQSLQISKDLLFHPPFIYNDEEDLSQESYNQVERHKIDAGSWSAAQL